MTRQQFAHEIAMALWNAIGDGGGRRVLFVPGGDMLGDEHVDSVGLAADILVDPFQFQFERARSEASRAEHTEAAGFTHFGDDIAAMTEGDEGKIDSEHFTYG